MSFVEAQNLGLFYGSPSRKVTALDAVNFSLAEDDCVAVTGPSGSGKSTLLALLGGFLTPTSGRCLVQGSSLGTMNSRKLADYRAKTLGFVFQQFCLLPHLTLLENVMLGVDHLTRERDTWIHRSQELLDRVGLNEQRNRRPHEVSGGQAQRAAIARALLRSPKLLLADEPTGSLDPDTAGDVLKLLRELGDEGRAIIVVTHSVDVAAAMPRLIELRDGKLIRDTGSRPSA